MKQNPYIKIAFILVLLWFSGCMPLPTQVPSVSEETPQSILPATATLTLTVTLTPTSSEIGATATQSLLPAITQQPPTKTPSPTLSADGMRTLILKLLKDNGGCRLPCLWGLTPGITEYATFHDFIRQFYELETPDVFVTIRDFGDVGGLSFIYQENNVHISVLFGYSKDDDSKLELFAMFAYPMYEYGTTPEGVLDLRPQYGDALFTQVLQYYTLPQILSTYGLPGRVLLATWPDDPDRLDIKSWPFSLVLLYPEQGIFVEYVAVRETVGSHFAGCPSKAHIYLGVWAPERALSLNDVAQKAGSVINELNVDYFKSVEEVTPLTFDEFYETFKNPANTSCLETPIDLWRP